MVLMALGGLVCLPLFFYVPGLLLERAILGQRSHIRGFELALMRIAAGVLLCGGAGFCLAWIGWWSVPARLLAVYLIALPPELDRWGRGRSTHSAGTRF